MEERTSQIAVVIGASQLAEELRRTLVRHGVPHAGVSTHLRGLRRSLAVGEKATAVLCIALDRATLRRHGVELRRLLADHQGFSSDVRSVGLLCDLGLTDEIAELGCDVYLDDSDHAADVVEYLTAAPNGHAAAPTTTGAGPARREAAECWMFGDASVPARVTSGLAARLDRLDLPSSVAGEGPDGPDGG